MNKYGKGNVKLGVAARAMAEVRGRFSINGGTRELEISVVLKLDTIATTEDALIQAICDSLDSRGAKSLSCSFYVREVTIHEKRRKG